MELGNGFLEQLGTQRGAFIGMIENSRNVSNVMGLVL